MNCRSVERNGRILELWETINYRHIAFFVFFIREMIQLFQKLPALQENWLSKMVEPPFSTLVF
jgi:hypothetical protein